MRVLITGAAGFAGSHLAEYLLSLGEEVIGLAQPDEKLTNLAQCPFPIRIERADLRDAESVAQILKALRPQHIYHLAAQSSAVRSFADPRFTYEVNFGGTLNILCAWRELEFNSRLLYVSSAEVYGAVGGEDLPLLEETPLHPTTPYAGSKVAAEYLAHQFFLSYGLPIVRVRPFNHTGPRQSPEFVCSSFAKQIVEVNAGLRPKTVSVGNLKVRRDFTDVRDIVRGYHLLLSRGEPGEVYQLCSGRGVSIEEVLQVLIGFASQSIQISVDQSKLRGQEAGAIWGDASKAARAVGWKPEYSLHTTLRDLELFWEEALRANRAAIS